MRKRNPFHARAWAALAILFTPLAAMATTIQKEASIVDLLGQSELILHGRVKNVTDGIDERGIPYTEVTLQVAEALKGKAGGEYTFRQFGLLKPRSTGNGHTNLMVTPAGWARYERGEDAILFLNKAAAWTGLRTTTGLGQGKFKISLAGAVNQFNNAGLFANVTVDQSLLGDSEKRVLSNRKGAVNARAFAALVKQAASGMWVEKGRMRNAR